MVAAKYVKEALLFAYFADWFLSFPATSQVALYNSTSGKLSVASLCNGRKITEQNIQS